MFRPGASLGVSAAAPSFVDASFQRMGGEERGVDSRGSGSKGKGKGKGKGKSKGKSKSNGKAQSASSSAHAIPAFVPVKNRSHFPTLPTLDAPGTVSDVVECSQDTTDDDEPPVPLNSQAKRDARRRRATARRVLLEFYRAHQPEKATHSAVAKLLQNPIPKLCKALLAKYGTIPEAWRAHMAVVHVDEDIRKRSRDTTGDKKKKSKKSKK